MRDNSLGCSAESRTCDGGSGWGPGIGGTGGQTGTSGGGNAGAGGGGNAGAGGGGPTSEGRRPGTGCDPRSNDFRDIANWRDAKHAVTVFKVCEAAGGTSRILTKAPMAADEEWRLTGVVCYPISPPREDQADIYSFPTTLACYNLAWADSGG